MTQREAKKVFPTMKIEAKNDDDLSFIECEATVIDTKDVETKFGKKVVMTLYNEALNDFDVFVNNYSMEKLINAYGSNDEYFLGKIVSLSKEKDAKYKKDMIVLTPKSN